MPSTRLSGPRAASQPSLVPSWLRGPLALGVLLVLALLTSACGSTVLESTPTPTPTPTPTATPTPWPATPTVTPIPTPTPHPDAEAVRDIDFSHASVVGPLVDRFGGGHVEQERIVYADMTGDGVEEAVVVVESGGTMGDLGLGIFRADGGQPDLVQVIEGGGRVEVLFADAGFGVLRLLEAAPQPGDPMCCPSRLRETVYEWDGDEFAIVTEQLIDNPDA